MPDLSNRLLYVTPCFRPSGWPVPPRLVVGCSRALFSLHQGALKVNCLLKMIQNNPEWQQEPSHSSVKPQPKAWSSAVPAPPQRAEVLEPATTPAPLRGAQHPPVGTAACVQSSLSEGVGGEPFLDSRLRS